MRTKTGVITSAKMQGTVTVTVHRHMLHPVYHKRFRRSKKFLADTGDFTDLAEGDTVLIAETRPLSKRKFFRIMEVVKRAPRVSEVAEEDGVADMSHKTYKDGIQKIQGIQKKRSSESSESLESPESSST